MNRNSVFSAAMIALAMFASACSQSSNPTAAGPAIGGPTSGDPGVLAKLFEPAAYVDPIDNSNYRLVFSAYASGSSNSEPMIATRTIERVEFEVRAPSGALIDKETAREVVTSGIQTGENSGSLSVVADVMWPVSSSISRGSYVVAVVRGKNGEVLTRRAELPMSAQ